MLAMNNSACRFSIDKLRDDCEGFYAVLLNYNLCLYCSLFIAK